MAQLEERKRKSEIAKDGDLGCSKRRKKECSMTSGLACDQIWHSVFLLYKTIYHLSPKIFLHRNLQYRKYFSHLYESNVQKRRSSISKRPHSRNSGDIEVAHKRTKIECVAPQLSKERDIYCDGELQILLHGVIDESGSYEDVDVEAIVTKINGSKNNHCASGSEDSSMKSIGKFKLPCRNNGKGFPSPVVFIVPKEAFTPLNGHLSWTSWLMFKCTLHAAKSQERHLRRSGHRQASTWRSMPNITRTAIMPLSSGGATCLSPGRMDLKFWKTGKSDDLSADNLKSCFPLAQSNGSNMKFSMKLDQDSVLWLKSEVRWVTVNNNIAHGPSVSFESSNSVKVRLKHTDLSILNGLNSTKQRKPQALSPCSAANSKFSESTVPSNLEYRFIRTSLGKNGGPQSVQVDTKPEISSRCFLCNVWCEDLYSLLKHLRSCHFRFAFTYKTFGDKQIVEVKLNKSSDLKDDPTWRNRKAKRESIYYFRNAANQNCDFDLERNLEEFKFPASLLALVNTVTASTTPKRPNALKRLYYCGETCVPLTKEEVDRGDNDSTPEWLLATRKKLIDEFSDVNLAEKEIMKMWNEHILKYNFFGDDRMFSVCDTFWNNYGQSIISSNYKANFALHLANFCNDGLLSQKEFYTLMLKVKSTAKQSFR